MQTEYHQVKRKRKNPHIGTQEQFEDRIGEKTVQMDDANRMLHVVYQLFVEEWGLVFKTGDIVHSYKFARVKFSRITSNE